MTLNKIQILGIVAIALVTLAIIPKFNLPPFGNWEDLRKNNASQMFLGAAVIVTGIALVLTNSGDSENTGTKPPEQYQQPTPPQPPPPFVMRDGGGGAGGPKSAESFKKDGKSIGQQLKDAGWVVVLADWCGFCQRQKALFQQYPDAELDLIVLTEDEGKANDKLHIQGFPHWECITNGKQAPGFKPKLEMIVALLD